MTLDDLLKKLIEECEENAELVLQRLLEKCDQPEHTESATCFALGSIAAYKELIFELGDKRCKLRKSST